MRLTICFNDQDRTLYAELGPGEESEEISLVSINGKVEAAGYHNLTLNPTAISELLANVQEAKECKIALKILVDATVSVVIASDKRQATVTLTAADGGQPLTLDLITRAIANAGVADSLIDQAVVNDCFQRQSVKEVCIAQARLPINGRDAEYTPLVESERITPPNVDDHGVADIVSTHQFLVVDVGTPLMRRVPATEGEAGMDVTGTELKTVPGKDPGFATNLTGVVISTETNNLLVAAIKGHPVIVHNGVNIDPTLHVDNVDVNTGNVRFDGSLEVKGDVAAGMTIDVTGDVFIKGGVDRAHIKAGHSIKVGGGIFGEEDAEGAGEQPFEYRIQAGLDIEAKFANLATLKAENNIVVKEYLNHSYVKSGNHVLLGQDTGKGIVFGGRCVALHRVVVNQLGNEAYIPTHVMAGELNELTKVYHNLEKELETRSQEVTQLEAILQKTQTGDPVLLGKVPLDKTQKIRHTIIAINEEMVRTQDLLGALEPELELQKHAAIEVTRTIYPNALMTINGTSKHFSEKTGGTTWVQWGEAVVEQGKVEQEKNVQQEKKE